VPPWVLIVTAAAAGVGGWLSFGPEFGPGLPSEVAGFELATFGRAEGLPNLRPPIGPSAFTPENLPDAVEYRVGDYYRGEVHAAVSVMDLDVTPVTGEELAAAYGIDQGEDAELDGFVIDGAQFVCVTARESAACAWASDDETGVVIDATAADLAGDFTIDPVTGDFDQPLPPSPQIEPIRELTVTLREQLG
jgi:hypothetical protein